MTDKETEAAQTTRVSPSQRLWDAVKLPLALVLSLRISLGTIGWAALNLFPRQWEAVVPSRYNKLLVSRDSWLFPFVQPWQRWDALEYERLANSWYHHGDPQAGFYPLFPALIRVVETVTGSYALAALLIATVASVVALAVMHRLISLDFDHPTADRSLVYLALAPTAFFFLAGYTESLFLAFVVGTFLAARSGRSTLAALLTSAAVLTRAQGVLLIAPLFIYLWRERRKQAITFLVLPVAAYGLHFLWLKSLGFPGGGTQIQEMFWGKSFGHPLKTISRSVETVIAAPWQTMEVLNLVAVAALVAAIPFIVRRRFPWPYIVYTATSVALMAWTESQYSPLQAADRYVLVVFPLFVLFGVAGRRLWLDRLFIAIFAPLQGFLFFYFTQYRFVG